MRKRMMADPALALPADAGLALAFGTAPIGTSASETDSGIPLFAESLTALR